MATKGHGVKFESGNAATHGASSTWTPFAKIVDVTPPSVEADDIDVSHMESPDQFKEFDPGWSEGQDVELTIQYDATENERVYALFRVPRGFQMTFIDGSKWKFSGYIKAFGNEVDREGIITAPVTVKISGKPEFVKAAAE